MTTQCVGLSDFGIVALINGVVVMSNHQYNGRTICIVRYQTDD